MLAVVSLLVEAIPCLKDNYAYLVCAPGASEAIVVDPSEASPVWTRLRARGLRLRGVLATHHHPDHVGGIPALLENVAAAGEESPWVAAHVRDEGRVPRLTRAIDAPTDRFVPITELPFLPGFRLWGRHIPGHTRAAIAWAIGPESSDVPEDVFTGDTLFGAGCGRLLEGTPAEMFTSLRALTSLPDGTRLWFGHEYTVDNLRFAAAVDEKNPAVAARARDTVRGAPSTPTTVGVEKATNPFVRASSVEELAARRAAKDVF